MTYKKTLLTEISNHSIGNWNKIKIEKLPIGVDVYVTFERVTNLENAKHLTDILKVKNNGSYAQPRELFIHTIGTSTDNLILDLVAITSTNEDYFENIPKQELALKAKIEEALLIGNRFLPSEILTISLQANSNYLLDVAEAQGVKYIAKGPLSLQFNGNGGKYPIAENKEYDLFLQLLGSTIKFYNDTAETVEINFQIMGQSKFKNMDYVESGYVENGYIF